MCSIQALVTKCIVYLEEEEPVAEESLTYEFVPDFLLSITSRLILSNTGPGGSFKCFKNL